jgi:hypothetical protein
VLGDKLDKGSLPTLFSEFWGSLENLRSLEGGCGQIFPILRHL